MFLAPSLGTSFKFAVVVCVSFPERFLFSSQLRRAQNGQRHEPNESGPAAAGVILMSPDAHVPSEARLTFALDALPGQPEWPQEAAAPGLELLNSPDLAQSDDEPIASDMPHLCLTGPLVTLTGRSFGQLGACAARDGAGAGAGAEVGGLCNARGRSHLCPHPPPRRRRRGSSEGGREQARHQHPQIRKGARAR